MCSFCGFCVTARESNESRGLMTRPHIQKALAAHDEMRAAGAEIGVAVGIDAALAQLEDWRFLRGGSQ